MHYGLNGVWEDPLHAASTEAAKLISLLSYLKKMRRRSTRSRHPVARAHRQKATVCGQSVHHESVILKDVNTNTLLKDPRSMRSMSSRR